MELVEILPMAAEVSGSFVVVVASGGLLLTPSSVVVLSALSCTGIDVVSSEDSILYLSCKSELEIYEAKFSVDTNLLNRPFIRNLKKKHDIMYATKT